MLSIRCSTALAGAALAMLAFPLPAQVAGPTLYRLDAPASYTQGCFPPCLCPLSFTEELFGTFTLEFDHAGPDWFDYYRVEDVNWVLRFGGVDRRVTGAGEFAHGGQLVLMERLVLDLSIDGGPRIRYDSGFTQTTLGFPARIDLSIAENGMYCYDTVFGVTASPVPAGEFVPYVLRRSGYIEGCYDPCDCPLRKWRAGGAFRRVALGTGSDPLRSFHAIVDASWHTPLSQTPPDHWYTGFGIYTLDRGAGTHRLVADLTELGTTRRFDSAEIPGGSTFPRIDIDAAVNGYVCYDYVFKVHAPPR